MIFYLPVRAQIEEGDLPKGDYFGPKVTLFCRRGRRKCEILGKMGYFEKKSLYWLFFEISKVTHFSKIPILR